MTRKALWNPSLNRRRFLHGLGACLALPAFESLLGRPALASLSATGSELAVSPSGAPLRMAFMYFPNGAIQDTWWPKGEGNDFEFNQTMKPLEALKHRVQVFSGLDHIN